MQASYNKHILMVLLVGAFSTPLWANVYTVTNINDAGAGSLRQAIIEANANSGFDFISFNINNHAAGPFTIKVQSPLPTIDDPVKMDGFTQKGEGVHAIEISGEDLPAPIPIPVPTGPTIPDLNTSNYAAGLLLWGRDPATPGATAPPRDCIGGFTPGCKFVKNPDGSTIRGLVINKFPRQGIYSYGADNLTIIGNYLGLDTTGNKSGFSNGRQNVNNYPHDAIRLEGSRNNFIGTVQADYPGAYSAINRNVIGSSTRGAIAMTYLNENVRGFNGCDPVVCRKLLIGYNNNVIQGNYIGTNAAGNCIIGGVTNLNAAGVPIAPFTNPDFTPLLCVDGNPLTRPLASIAGPGIFMAANIDNFTEANNNVIGGLKPGQGNVMVSHGASLIAHNFKLLGNIVGRDATGQVNLLGSLGSGFTISSTYNSLIQKNIIARNSAQFSTPTSTTAALNLTFLNTATAPFVPFHKNLTIVDNEIVDNFNFGVISFVADEASSLAGNGIKLGYDIVNGKIVPKPNVIARNQKTGVVVERVTALPVPNIRMAMLYNKIYDNDTTPTPSGFLGLDLVRAPATAAPLIGDGVNLNDPLDADIGSNSLQNYPVLNAQKSFVTTLLASVEGTLNSEPNKDYLIQVFANEEGSCVAVPDQSPLTVDQSPLCSDAAFPFLLSQGKVFVGEKLVRTDANGNVNFKVVSSPIQIGSLPIGLKVITSTATLMSNVDGVLVPIETSEFSQAVDVDKRAKIKEIIRKILEHHHNSDDGGNGWRNN